MGSTELSTSPLPSLPAGLSTATSSETDTSILIQLNTGGRLGLTPSLWILHFTQAMVRYISKLVVCILCADTKSHCEPWEDRWNPSLTFSCLSTCLAGMSTCTVLRVRNAGWYDCNGDYDLLDIQAPWAPDMPLYKLRRDTEERYLFSHGTQWKIGPKYTSPGGYHISRGECYSVTRFYFSLSLIYHNWLQEL